MIRRGLLLLLIAICPMLLLAENLLGEEPARDLPDLGLGVFNAPSWLPHFSIEAVRKEIRLSDKQLSAIDELKAKLKAESAEFRKSVAVVADNPVAEEDQKRIRHFYSQLNKQAEDGLREILNKSQLQRIQQISLQMERGGYAIRRPPLADILKLSDNQRTEIANLDRKFWEERRAEAKAPVEPKESFDDALVRLDKQTAAILTEDQRRRLQELKGPSADAIIAEIRADVAKKLEAAAERARAKRAAAGNPESRTPAPTPPDKK
jgi:hypothetical protein